MLETTQFGGPAGVPLSKKRRMSIAMITKCKWYTGDHISTNCAKVRFTKNNPDELQD
jgi:hypothetical protein